MNSVYTVHNCAYTVHVLKNIKNRSHDTIYTFKYYFATVFSIFSNNKFNPNTLDIAILEHDMIEILKLIN